MKSKYLLIVVLLLIALLAAFFFVGFKGVFLIKDKQTGTDDSSGQPTQLYSVN